MAPMSNCALSAVAAIAAGMRANFVQNACWSYIHFVLSTFFHIHFLHLSSKHLHSLNFHIRIVPRANGVQEARVTNDQLDKACVLKQLQYSPTQLIDVVIPVMEDVCWICRGSEGELRSHCSCSFLLSHEQCLLQWCIYSAGTIDERPCRFCKTLLPDWRTLLPPPGEVPVMMSIAFNDCIYFIQADSQQQFQEDVRRLLQLPADTDLDITFECKLPGADDCKLELHGMDTYETAVYCASAAAGHLAATSSSSSAAQRDQHCRCDDSSSDSSGSSCRHHSSSDEAFWHNFQDDDEGLVMFSNAMAVQLAECADDAVSVVTSALGNMFRRALA